MINETAKNLLLELHRECKAMKTVEVFDLVMFGQELRAMRLGADISLREMARRLNLSAPFLSDCELGRRNLKLNAQIKYVEFCSEEGE